MTTLDSKHVITRKEHQCWGCARTYPKGTRLQRMVNVDAGSAYSVYWCPVCEEMWTMVDLEDGIEFGGFKGEDEWEKLRELVEREQDEQNEKEDEN